MLLGIMHATAGVAPRAAGELGVTVAEVGEAARMAT